MRSFLMNNKHVVVLCVFIFLYIAYFTTASFLRHENFYTGRYDLGNMDQAVWNTLHGRFLEVTNEGGEGTISRLSSHADVILALLAPFYIIWEDPRMLLFIQTIALALGAVFVYLISQNIIKNKNISVAFAFVYLTNPSVQFSNIYDFHAVTFATTFLLGAFYFILKNNYLWFVLFAILAGITKEQVWIVVALLSGYVFLRSFITHETIYKRTKIEQMLGLILFLFSSITFYYLIWHFIPSFRGGNHFALDYYSEFGDSPTRIVQTVLLSPQKVILDVIKPEKIYYLMKLFSPIAFFSLLSPQYLIFALPDLTINMLSKNTQLHQIYYQYTAAITPFLFISAIFGLRHIKKTFPKVSTNIWIIILISLSLYSAYKYGPLPFAQDPNIQMFVMPQKDKEEIKREISKIPTNSAVSTTNNLGANLTHRRIIHTIPEGVVDSEYLIFLYDSNQYPNLNSSIEQELVTKLKNDKLYKIVFEKNKFIIFKRSGL